MKGGKTVTVKLKKDKDAHITMQGHERVASLQWSSPLPPPQVMGDYAKASPDLVPALLRIVESQNAHHCEMERMACESQLSVRLAEERTKRWELLAYCVGKTLAATIAIAGFALCGYFVARGNPKLASLLCGGELSALVALFFRSRRSVAEPPNHESS